MIRRPGFFAHVGLLWQLRLQIALNANAARGPWISSLTFVGACLPSVGLTCLALALLRTPVIASSAVWPPFLLNLLCFVTAAVWCVWPVLSAGVDDHSEISRFNAFPLSSVRLLFASTVASVLEPRALFFFGPVLGAVAGFVSLHPVRAAWALGPLALLYVCLVAAWSRAALHLVLNVLQAKRNVAIIGGSSFAFLVLATLIPPIDTSWLQQVGQTGVSAIRSNVLADAALALSRVPPGFFGDAVLALSEGRPLTAAVDAIGLALFASLGFGAALALLHRFHLRVERGGGKSFVDRDNPFARTRSALSTLIAREAMDLWRNPRARLLLAVPFVLGILIKLLSGRALFQFAVGESADAWLMGGLSLYGAVVIASTFSQNMFAYDGLGLALFLAAPVELRQVMRAKNVVHAAGALALGFAVSAFYRIYFRHGSALDWAVSFAAVLALVPVALAAGNFLSLYFPVKFHANLKRRDKLPLVASMLGVVAASIGSGPFALALRHSGREAPTLASALLILGFAALGWIAYAVSFPWAVERLALRRERILSAVTRD